MTEGIRNRPPPKAPGLQRGASPDGKEATLSGAQQSPLGHSAAAGASAKEAGASHDTYEASQAAHAQFKQHIQATTSRSLKDLHFSNQELETIAQSMLEFVKAHPNASRAARAKGFAKAVLKSGRGKLGNLLAAQGQAQAEEMFEDIGNMLSESPRLAEWLESLTEQLKAL